MGAPTTGEFQVNTYTTYYQGAYGGPDVAADGAGNFVAAWDGAYQDGDSYGVFARRVNSTGPVGSEFQVNSHTTSSQGFAGPVVGADAAGDFTIVWSSDLQDGTPGIGVYLQRFLSDGTPVGGEQRVNTYTTGLQWFPAIAADWRGCQQIVWRSGGPDSMATCGVDTDCPKYPGETCVAGVCERIDQQDGEDAGIFAQRYCRAPALNHYRCYRVKDLKLPPWVNHPGVTVVDQFSSQTLTVKKIRYLCNPVDKNGEGIADPGLHLCCYGATGPLLSPAPTVDVGSQFQNSRLRGLRGQVLCTPCAKTELGP